jgi:alpha-L-rhamnosidase
MPGFELAEPVALYAKGRFERIKPETYYKDRSLTIISPTLKGYSEAELEVPPQSQAIQEVVTSEREIINKPPISAGAVALREGEFYIYDFGRDYSGFIGARLTCGSRTKICFHFDELLTDGDVLPMQRQPDINNQVVYELEPGSYDLESFETYTFRYLKALLWEGDCRIENVYVREFAYPAHPKATFHSSHAKLNRIYDAARQTSRQNALDVFMDCPSRERAGWLCDSYYAAIMEKELTGRADVAHNFYENYALPDSFRYLPEGMIPMCYPADHNDRIFIPNWSLWFILQVEDYALRGGDPRLVAQLKTRIEKLLGYFARFENEDGLLEKLERWIFLEWSKANEFVRDVNYPTNMLYAAALSSAARLYGNERWEQKAQDIRQTIVRQSFDGEFFVDNALRNQDGVLETTANTTEVCQYYAFYFGLATPDSHPELWRKLITHFGPNRNDAVVYPTVFRANAFMGNYMRMDILSRFGRQGQLILEIQDYFYAMADQTGTLWEHTSHHASCNHGFASYIGHVLYRDVLGITHIDYRAKAVTIRFADLVMDHCSGSIPIGNDCVALKWKRDGNRIHYSLHVPEGYSVILQNDTPAILEHDESISGVPSTLIFLTKQTYLFL